MTREGKSHIREAAQANFPFWKAAGVQYTIFAAFWTAAGCWNACTGSSRGTAVWPSVGMPWS